MPTEERFVECAQGKHMGRRGGIMLKKAEKLELKIERTGGNADFGSYRICGTEEQIREIEPKEAKR